MDLTSLERKRKDDYFIYLSIIVQCHSLQMNYFSTVVLPGMKCVNMNIIINRAYLVVFMSLLLISVTAHLQKTIIISRDACMKIYIRIIIVLDNLYRTILLQNKIKKFSIINFSYFL